MTTPLLDSLDASTSVTGHPSKSPERRVPYIGGISSISPAAPLVSLGLSDGILNPAQARAYFNAFREFAADRRRRELLMKGRSSSQAGIDNNVEQLKTALNLIEKCLSNTNWNVDSAIDLARASSKRPSELTRASRLWSEFRQIKPVTTPAKQFGIRVREIISRVSIKPSHVAKLAGLSESSIYRWMSGDTLPHNNERNRTAAATLERLVDKPGYLQPLLRPSWKTVERPSYISKSQWRPILERLRRGGYCDLEGAELARKIEELSSPTKRQRAPYRFPRKLSDWPPVPRAEIEAYNRLAQLRSEPIWN